jgi:hypothetical protein
MSSTGTSLTFQANIKTDTSFVEIPTFVSAAIGRGAGFDGDSQVTFGNIGDFDRGEPFTIAFWVRSGSNQPISLLQKLSDPAKRRGYEFAFADRSLIGIQRWAQRLSFNLISQWPENLPPSLDRQSLPHGRVDSGKPDFGWHWQGCRSAMFCQWNPTATRSAK